MKRIAALILALFVSACVAEVTPEKLSTIKTLGVISFVDDDVTLKKIGFIVFLNEEKTFHKPEWGLRHQLFERIKTELGNRFDVRETTYPEATFGGGKVATRSTADLMKEVQPQGLDAYLIVVNLTSAFPGTNQTYQGIGLLRTSSAFDVRVRAYESYGIALIDGHDFKRLGGAGAGGMEDVDPAMWPDPIDKPTEAQMEKIREALSHLPSDGLKRAFRFMHLEQ